MIRIDFETIDSTNNKAKEIVLGSSYEDDQGNRMAGGVLPLLVTAQTQTGGRGRYGKTFYSPEGGIYMSYAYEKDYTEAELLNVTTCVAELVLPVLQTHTSKQLFIKPINDIYAIDVAQMNIDSTLDGNPAIYGSSVSDNELTPEEYADAMIAAGAKKIVGILTERVDYPRVGASQTCGAIGSSRTAQSITAIQTPGYFVIVGIGININPQPIPAGMTDAEGKPLEDIIGWLEPDCDRNTLIDEIAGALGEL